MMDNRSFSSWDSDASPAVRSELPEQILLQILPHAPRRLKGVKYSGILKTFVVIL